MVNNREFNIFITGTSGLIGSHVLYEILHSICTKKYEAKIYILLRSKKDASIQDRLQFIFNKNAVPDYLKNYPKSELLEKIHVIEGDLRDDHLSHRLQQIIPRDKKLYILHLAAVTNLFSNKIARAEVYQNNYVATNKLLKAVQNYNIKFIFVSTIFSCGIKSGLLRDQYSDTINGTFRNPYESYKNKIEHDIKQYCTQNKIPFQIIRPSLVCGRLIDSPKYYTTKFDVFYAFTKFFYRLVKKGVNDSVRITVNLDSHLNIVPVDFVAKAIEKAFLNDEIIELNPVDRKGEENVWFVPALLNHVGFHSFRFVRNKPRNLNMYEKVYYKTVGAVFTKYMCAPKV
ncbi:MAG: SDR family oxidoreductase, partial [Spirochaetia bacterium]